MPELLTGSVDPDRSRARPCTKEMRSRQASNDIIAEAQAQIDAWKASK